MSLESNPEITQTLQTMYERLMRASSVRVLAVPESPSQRLEDGLNRVLKGQRSVVESLTLVARGENYATPEQLFGLDLRIDALRRWLLTNGEYCDTAVVEGMPQYSWAVEGYQASAENPDELEGPLTGEFSDQVARGIVSRLDVGVSTGSPHFGITFWMNRTFNLEMEFLGRERLGKNDCQYVLNNMAWNQMTKDEATIISYYLGQYDQGVIGSKTIGV